MSLLEFETGCTTRFDKHPVRITGPELHVVYLKASGMLHETIGRVLGISPKTVESHMHNLLGEIGGGRIALYPIIAKLIFEGHFGIQGVRRNTAVSFSDREVDITRYSLSQFKDPEIASQLGIGVKTLESNRQKLYRKTGASNRAHFVGIIATALRDSGDFSSYLIVPESLR